MEGMVSNMDLSFYKGRTILVTGHTGFKGSWMCKVLAMQGAKVVGYALNPPTSPNLFSTVNIQNEVISVIGDISNSEQLNRCFQKYKPEIVIHMAAQPIVREGYRDPVGTYQTNVMGTVNVLEAVRCCDSVKSFVNVTTDKVYQNNEWEWGYREIDRLNGHDPYSNSKSCSELVTNSYKNSFFADGTVAITTCRAGNVIGGGDFAKDRIIPDCVRATENHEKIIVRNPYSIRPYQHVLEPVCAYLIIAQKQYDNKAKYEGCYNVGPDEIDCVTTGTLVDLFCKSWGADASWENVSEKNAPHEANFLKLDCSKLKTSLNWSTQWHIYDAIEKTVEWSKCWINGGKVDQIMKNQILEYLG